MKKLVKHLYIRWTVILFLGLVFRVKWNKDGMLKVGNTIIVMKNYDQEKELTVENRLGFEAEVKKYTDLIKNFKPGTGEKEIDLGNGIKGIAEIGRTPDRDRFLQKAENQKSLGRYNDAIKTLNSVFARYKQDVQTREGLARTYEEVGEYELAIEYYQKILVAKPDLTPQTTLKLITLYIALKDGESAGKLYVQYLTKDGGSKDPQIEKQIQALNFPSK